MKKNILIVRVVIDVEAPVDRKDSANEKTRNRILERIQSGKPLDPTKLLTKGEMKRGLELKVRA
jgi:hypothetical protein